MTFIEAGSAYAILEQTKEFLDAREELHTQTVEDSKAEEEDKAAIPITLKRQLKAAPMLFVLRKLLTFCPRYCRVSRTARTLFSVGVRLI